MTDTTLPSLMFPLFNDIDRKDLLNHIEDTYVVYLDMIGQDVSFWFNNGGLRVFTPERELDWEEDSNHVAIEWANNSGFHDALLDWNEMARSRTPGQIVLTDNLVIQGTIVGRGINQSKSEKRLFVVYNMHAVDHNSSCPPAQHYDIIKQLVIIQSASTDTVINPPIVAEIKAGNKTFEQLTKFVDNNSNNFPTSSYKGMYFASDYIRFTVPKTSED